MPARVFLNTYESSANRRSHVKRCASETEGRRRVYTEGYTVNIDINSARAYVLEKCLETGKLSASEPSKTSHGHARNKRGTEENRYHLIGYRGD